MIVYRTIKDLASHLDSARNNRQSIGLVPTMGALHRGHTSLVEMADAENDLTVVSIFVNPTQFNDPTDLEKYPRNLDQDLEILQGLDTDIAFVPSVKEMYPTEERLELDLGGLDQVMEGKYRVGHFNGVAQIVSKLFEAVQPHRAYFGQKDFQQLVIIRHLVKTMDLSISIIACPIIRDSDGLALSSRNALLSREEREIAPFIHTTLMLAREKAGILTPEEVRSWVTSQFEDHPLFRLEYFEIVDDKDLRPVTHWGEAVNKVGCIAVQLGEIRLIDNLNFN
jgi:pantoate--beta-alanine ligase